MGKETVGKTWGDVVYAIAGAPMKMLWAPIAYYKWRIEHNNITEKEKWVFKVRLLFSWIKYVFVMIILFLFSFVLIHGNQIITLTTEHYENTTQEGLVTPRYTCSAGIF